MTDSDIDKIHAPATDVVLSRREEDRLGRHLIVERLYRELTEAPDDWPVRVALHGAWGEGKTSIARLTSERAKAAKHLVVELNLSRIETIAELWLAFAQAIDEAIKVQGLHINTSRTIFYRLDAARYSRKLGWMGSAARTVGQVAGKSTGQAWIAPAIETAIAAGGGLMGSLLKVDQQFVDNIREAIGKEHRVIVILDDLDRADPKIIPEILLRLRDLLEIAGFSFLVPFDREIVARSLEQTNKSWQDADLFLEKIFDYRLAVPEPRIEARLRWILSEIKAYCGFAPDLSECAAAFVEVIPGSPRKLRSLIRHLWLYRVFAGTHVADEIDWWIVFWVEAFRQIHEGALRRLMAEDFWPLLMSKPFSTLSVSTREDKDRELDVFAEKLVGKAAVCSDSSAASIRSMLGKLAEYSEKVPRYKLIYSLRLHNLSPSVTDRDVFQFVKSTNDDQEAIISWIDQLAKQNAVGRNDIVDGIIYRLIRRYGSELDAVRLVTGHHEAEIRLRSSEDLLKSFSRAFELLDECEELVKHVDELLNTVRQWQSWVIPFYQQERRNAERAQVLRIVQQALGSCAMPLARLLVRRWENVEDARRRLELGDFQWVKLNEDLVDLIIPAVGEALLRCSTPEEAEAMFNGDYGSGVFGRLVRAESGPFRSGSVQGKALADILSQAGKDRQVSIYAMMILLAFKKCVEEGLKLGTGHEDMLEEIWKAAIAIDVTPRYRSILESVASTLMKVHPGMSFKLSGSTV
ncbi:KAP family P-loop NTPase fold protein [Geminicoccus flavidas]|uniref:KAP family P-loop NTPase fold protein n=1 Tax=Geminicoccus flavidas TaxID=2506407 RepID=UPI00135AA98F|nr:P-loop NTPase fold protein [Geminicoccus flavidas]